MTAPMGAADMPMQTSQAGQAFIKAREGLNGQPVLTAYKDSAGTWTLGFGTIKLPGGKPVTQGMTCTATQAQLWFLNDLSWAENAVRQAVQVPLTQPQFDALVSFTYNEGVGSFTASTMLKLLNAGQYRNAAAEFPKWDIVHVNGVAQVSQGLLNRRKAEQALFLTGTAQPISASPQ